MARLISIVADADALRERIRVSVIVGDPQLIVEASKIQADQLERDWKTENPAVDISNVMDQIRAEINAVKQLAAFRPKVCECLSTPIPTLCDTALADEVLSDIDEQVKVVEGLLGQLAWPAELPDPCFKILLENRRADLASARQHAIALADDRDWHTGATLSEREALCDKIEALIESPTPHSVLKRAKEIDSLRQQWNELEGVNSPREKELDRRFKRTVKKGLQPYHRHFNSLIHRGNGLSR